MEKAFEELQIKDDFMFSVIMRNDTFFECFVVIIYGVLTGIPFVTVIHFFFHGLEAY